MANIVSTTGGGKSCGRPLRVLGLQGLAYVESTASIRVPEGVRYLKMWILGEDVAGVTGCDGPARKYDVSGKEVLIEDKEA